MLKSTLLLILIITTCAALKIQVSNVDLGKIYTIDNDTWLNFIESNQFCNDNQAMLVMPRSSEVDFLFDGLSEKWFFVGARPLYSKVPYKFFDGSNITSIDWLPGYPKSHPGCNALAMSNENATNAVSSDQRWFDYSCNSYANMVVCEAPLGTVGTFEPYYPYNDLELELSYLDQIQIADDYVLE